jgi:hypothetical protein
MPKQPTETGFALFCVTNHGTKPTMLESDWRNKIPIVLRGYITALALRIYYCSECGYVELYYGDEKKAG